MVHRSERRGSVGFVLALAAGASLLSIKEAKALDAEVTSDTAAQFYDLRSPTGEVILGRRRLTTTLGVSAYDLLNAPEQGRQPLAPELSFRARVRYDADYGMDPGEVDPNNGRRFVPGLSRGPVDLMYGYVEGRRLFGGWFGFRLGRQYTVDPLGWYSFDGALVRATTPFYVAAEAYGGLEVRGGMPFSNGRWERGGVWRGDRTDYDPLVYPSFQPSAIAPVIGVGLESTGVTWLHGKLTYRRVQNSGSSNVTQFANGLYTPVQYDGLRISQERLGYSIQADWATVGSARAGLIYDLYVAKFTSLNGTLEGYVGQKLTLGIDYDFYRPTFDADSIWNFFATQPMNYLGARANYDVTDRIALSGTAYTRAFEVETSAINNNPSTNINPGRDPNYYPTDSQTFDVGGHLGARYRTSTTTLSLRSNGNFGSGGDRVGGDLAAQRVLEDRYVLSGRASLWQWDDKLRPDRDAISLGYVAGLGYRFAPRSQAMVEWEHNMNRLAGQRFRVMLWLTLAVAK